ncbi:crossover junction endodeoxyribonuclease RuvC [Aestuariivirga litoralis]|uniref:crossover junction endodeoxyribonuclease RuvC n=1 Tax=Aestuariivirga litoralis TaxID=2650924 RepID=UPI0018C65C5D|nr:crossover junction endodeoxyribonuclease RuvC [Aestuariivirga litoralis]MBG1230865.1 crossover junction endodeoxyribonuclease RuvC [Aestuariivirga litoralis]
MVRIIGLDPGLRHTGWGIIEAEGTRLSYVADGAVHSVNEDDLATRLLQIHTQVLKVLDEFAPEEAAIEETFVNKDARATLKLGQARGVVMLAPVLRKVGVFEYAPNVIKKSVVGNGHAEKDQVKHMVKVLLPRAVMNTADSTDALAIAICHAQHRGAHALKAKLAQL